MPPHPPFIKCNTPGAFIRINTVMYTQIKLLLKERLNTRLCCLSFGEQLAKHFVGVKLDGNQVTFSGEVALPFSVLPPLLIDGPVLKKRICCSCSIFFP